MWSSNMRSQDCALVLVKKVLPSFPFNVLLRYFAVSPINFFI